jgi:hypothetical protein
MIKTIIAGKTVPRAGSFGDLTLVAGVYTCTPQVLIHAGTILIINGTATDVCGRLLTQTAVTLNINTITKP